MSTIFIQLQDLTIVEIHSGFNIINPRINNIRIESQNNHTPTSYRHMSTSSPDPFGLKPPIPSGNKKY